MLIEYEGVGHVFERDGEPTPALDDVSFGVARGEFVALVGPSGCGKSTLLNLTAGLLHPTRGLVRYAGDVVAGVNSRLGYVTQQDTLLPWRRVFANIALPLEMRGVGAQRQRELVDQYLDMVGLRGFERHYPSELSGGMRKRVLLARALVYHPETLLMDEPFAAVDAQLRQVLQEELLRLYARLGATVIFVTHDLQEAITLADRVVIFSARPARVKQIQPIDLPRPRDPHRVKLSPRFAALYDALWGCMQEDIRRGEVMG